MHSQGACEIRLSQEKGQCPPCRWDLYPCQGHRHACRTPQKPLPSRDRCCAPGQDILPWESAGRGNSNHLHHESSVGTLPCKIWGASQRWQFHRLWWMEPHLTHASGEAQQGKTAQPSASHLQPTTPTTCPAPPATNSHSFCIHTAPRAAPGGGTAVSGRSLAEQSLARLPAALLHVTLPREGAIN